MKVTLIRSRAIDPSVNKIAYALSKNGHEVKLLVWDRQHNPTYKEKNNTYVTSKFNFRAPYDKLSVVFYLPFWWIYEVFFILKSDSDVIHACDLDTLIPATIGKLFKRYKLYYTIYDFYSENIPAKVPMIIKRSVEFLELFNLRFVDYLFLVDEERLHQVKKGEIKSIAYIYNSPIDRFTLKNRADIGTNSELIIFYAGIILKSRGLEYLVKAVDGLDNVRLVIAGNGPDVSMLNCVAMGRNTRIQYIGWINYEELIERTLDSDVVCAFYDPTIPNNRYASPNKLFEAMMCGKPIITNSGTTAAKIVKKENCGIIVPYGNVNALRNNIILLKDKHLRNELGKNGRKAYENKYNWNIMEERLLSAYRKNV